MPKYQYVARDSSGNALTGTVQAADKSTAARTLRSEGKIVVSITSGGLISAAGRVIPPEASLTVDRSTPKARQSSMLAPKLDPEDVREFMGQLAVMLETGVGLCTALETCQDPKHSPGFAVILTDLASQVQAGSPFSQSLARHPRAFSPLMINMVRAAEASGRLGPMLRSIADFIARQRDLNRKIVGAIAYPMVMLMLSCGVVIFLLTFVLPKFAAIYAGRENVLPAISRVMMSMSGVVQQYWVHGLAVVGAAMITVAFYTLGERGRPIRDRLKLAVPLFGPLMHKTYLARSLRTLGTLLQSGVALLEALELTRNAVGNQCYERMWGDVNSHLQQGRQLSDILRDHPLVPRSIAKMIEAGEQSGQVGNVMVRVAEHCENDIATDVKTITSLMEPAIVVFLGGVVGTVVMALLLPIFTISRAMRPS